MVMIYVYIKNLLFAHVWLWAVMIKYVRNVELGFLGMNKKSYLEEELVMYLNYPIFNNMLK